jgi:tetratricopeptide (TPR) repeat protein
MGFFWRQVVAKSPPSPQASVAYQEGWNALNQFIREDYSWSGRQPNVLHVRRGNRYFDFSGISGLDVAEDSRAYAVTDFDGDGRPDILLKSRLGPQLRVLQNNCTQENHSLGIHLQGTKSNRDAIGAHVRVDGHSKWLESGSGFISQHSKRFLFGLGNKSVAQVIEVTWPSGSRERFGPFRAGFTYSIKEGSTEVSSQPFRVPAAIRSSVATGHNELSLADTWLLGPLPLPERQTGPALLVVHDGRRPDVSNDLPLRWIDLATAGVDRRKYYEIFRRYLFDYRAPLEPPLAFLLNADGNAVKVYSGVPATATIRNDLAQLKQHAMLALPFSGEYVVTPHRDYAKFGIAYLLSGYPDQALPYFNSVLQRTPNNARVLVLAGQIHMDAHRFAEAEECFRRAVNSERATPEALYGLALALARQDRFREAQSYFEQAIEARPAYAEAINDLGTLFVQHGKIDDAIAAFQYGIKVAPEEDILYLNLGRTFAKLGQFDRARQVMQQLLDRKPDSPTARRALQELSGR